MSMIFPPLTMREVDRVCGEVRRPDWAVRTETKLLVSLPAKVYPWAAEIHISRLRARSVCFSEEGEAVTLTLLSPEETSLTIPSFPPKKKDNTSDNMSTSDFTEGKDKKKSIFVKPCDRVQQLWFLWFNRRCTKEDSFWMMDFYGISRNSITQESYRNSYRIFVKTGSQCPPGHATRLLE